MRRIQTHGLNVLQSVHVWGGGVPSFVDGVYRALESVQGFFAKAKPTAKILPISSSSYGPLKTVRLTRRVFSKAGSVDAESGEVGEVAPHLDPDGYLQLAKPNFVHAIANEVFYHKFVHEAVQGTEAGRPGSSAADAR